MAVGYDKKSMQHDELLLSLPFCEATGLVFKDIAKPHHFSDGLNITWTTLPSGLQAATFNGASAYTDILAADSADLNIMAQDYSVVGWINYNVLAQSQIIIGRYGVDLDGWELYIYSVNHTLNLRHHHASLVPTRTGCYSLDWTTGQWHLLGISRIGAYPLMYRNGEEVAVTYDVGGLSDPDTCNRDLVVGIRYTKDANWYSGYMHGFRVWVGKALTTEEHRHIFNTERRWFDV
jgi:hypothetical protein